MRNYWAAAALLVSFGLCLGQPRAEESTSLSVKLVGLFCPTSGDVKNILRRIASGDGADLEAEMTFTPDTMNCSFETRRVTVVDVDNVSIGNRDYVILHFKDGSGGDCYSWKQLIGVPA